MPLRLTLGKHDDSARKKERHRNLRENFRICGALNICIVFLVSCFFREMDLNFIDRNSPFYLYLQFWCGSHGEKLKISNSRLLQNKNNSLLGFRL